MKISVESGALLAANLVVGAAHIYLNPRSAVLSLIFGMAFGSYEGTQAVRAAFSNSHAPAKESQVNGLLDALPKYGTLFLGSSALFAAMNRIGTTHLLGSEQNAMSLHMIVLGYFLGKSFKIKTLYDQVQMRLTAPTMLTDIKTRFEAYRDAII